MAYPTVMVGGWERRRTALLAGTWWFLLATSLGGCVLRLNDGESREEGGSKPSPAPESDTFACPTWEAGTPQDIDAAVETAIAELESEGTPIDASVWNDPTRFTALVRRTYEVSGCEPPPEGVRRQRLGTEPSDVYFCGPGFGEESLLRPPVSHCLNRACALHDACYAMCDDDVGSCLWSRGTESCDDTFFYDAAACPLSLLDRGVLAIARGLSARALVDPRCTELSCPSTGGLGNGVCSLDRSGADCQECLNYFDPNGACLATAEAEHGDVDDFCYAARCEAGHRCFGESPPSNAWVDSCDGFSVVPGATTWRLQLISTTIPPTKPSGADWDVDVFDVTPPDPRVVTMVAATQASATSATADDEFMAFYEETTFPSLAADTALGGFTFDVWDIDVIDDDYIGTCSLPVTLDSFCAGPIEANCQPEGLSVRVKLSPTVAP